MSTSNLTSRIIAGLALGLIALGASGTTASFARESGSRHPVTPAYYDELRLPNGQVRPQYRGVLKVFERMSAAERHRYHAASRRDFKGDNALSALPRVLTREESDLLRRGAEQRMKAIRSFLQEYHSGKTGYQAVIPEQIVQRIFDRSHESGLRRLVDPQSIAFRFRLDVIRGPDGRFYVLEDNPGFVGGPGDLSQARETLLKRIPDYSLVLDPIDNPEEYYRTLVARARARARPPGGRIVMYMVPPYADHEDSRLRRILGELDVDVVTPNTKQRLNITREGATIRRGRTGASQRVGYIMLNGEHKWMDVSHAIMREAWLKSDIEMLRAESWVTPAQKERLRLALIPDPSTGRVNPDVMRDALRSFNAGREWVAQTERYNLPGLVDAMLAGTVRTDYSPGIDGIGDKEFNLYVDELVRHYLKEEPILRNIPTRRFVTTRADGRQVLDERRLDEIFQGKNFENWVVKVVDGRGGDGVYVGPKTARSKIPAIMAEIRKRPEAYIAQRFTHLSVLDNQIVDLGILGEVGPDDVYVSKTFWGRSVPLDNEDGLVNLSKRGVESPVVVVENPIPPGYRCVGDRLVEIVQ